MADIDIGKIAFKFTWDGKEAEAGIKRMQGAFGTLRKIVTTVVAGKMIRDVTHFGRELVNLSDRTGMSVQKLSSLRNIFISAGSGAKGFQATIENINKGLRGLERGETDWATRLYPTGISPWGKQADEIQLEIADWAKNAISMGTSKEQVLDYLTSVLSIPEEMARLMLGGRKAILDENDRLLKKVGQPKHIEEIDSLKKSLDDLSAAWDNAKTSVIGFLGEPLMKGVDAITSVVKYLGDNEVVGAITALGVALAGFKGTSAVAGMIHGGGTAITAGGIAAGAASFTAVASAIFVIADCAQGLYDYFHEGAAGAINRYKKEAANGEVPWYAFHKYLAIGFGYWGEEFADFLSDPKAMQKFFDKNGNIDYDAIKARREELEYKRMNGGLTPKEVNENMKLAKLLENLQPMLEEMELMKDVKVIYADEPIVEDLEGSDNSKVINVEVHQEGSTYGGTSEDVKNATTDGVKQGLKFAVNSGG